MRKKTTVLRGLEPWFLILLDETYKYWQYDVNAREWAESGLKGMFTNN